MKIARWIHSSEVFLRPPAWPAVLLAAFLAVVLGGCQALGLGAEPTPTPEAAAPEDFTALISATGVVVPARWTTLSVAGSGEVEALPVAEGERVPAGRLLVRLSGGSRLKAEITAGELGLLAARQDLDQLNENAAQVRAQAEMRLANARKALEDAQKHRSWKNYRNGSPESIDRARADLVLAQDQVKKAEEAFNGVADRGEDDVIRAAALSALAAARKARDRAESNLNYLLKIPDEVEVAQADAEVAVATTELEAAQREWERVKDGPDPDQLQLAQAAVENAQAQLEAGQMALEDLQLIAPFDGVVSKLYLRLNQWVAPGQPAILFADLNELRVETTDLSEIDVARLNVGDPVSVTFDALPGVAVNGRITHIASKAAEGSGVNYTVIVELEQAPERLLWGMTAFVDIEVAE